MKTQEQLEWERRERLTESERQAEDQAKALSQRKTPTLWEMGMEAVTLTMPKLMKGRA